MTTNTLFQTAKDRIQSNTTKVGIIGLGYVGLPLAITIARVGFPTTGFDIDQSKIDTLQKGLSYIDAVPNEELSPLISSKQFRSTTNLAELGDMDIIIICVPTPLTKHKEPDMSFIEGTSEAIAATLKPGQIVVLESTTYPGTTNGLMKPILEANGLKSGKDFFIGFSPEREDPGNQSFNTATMPKIVSGDGPEAAELIQSFYAKVVDKAILVASPEIAEASKLTENIFRAVNIALVNELKIIYDKMGIDIWDVIDAAKSKPFGYMPFYPGPGLGGHCIPIDPFYLTWASRAYDVPTRFIELAGEINISMPRYVVTKLEEALDRRAGKSLSTSRILIIGAAYKKNVNDMRESPSLQLLDILKGRGVDIQFHDPHVPIIPSMREHPNLTGMKSVDISHETIGEYDAVLISTDHDLIDYQTISKASLIIDTRNAMTQRGLFGANVIKA